jgi:hypothetical protein
VPELGASAASNVAPEHDTGDLTHDLQRNTEMFGRFMNGGCFAATSGNVLKRWRGGLHPVAAFGDHTSSGTYSHSMADRRPPLGRGVSVVDTHCNLS